MEIINSELAPKAVGPYSQATKANGFVFISGQLPIDAKTNELKTDIKEATITSLTHLDNILKKAGTDRKHVLKVTIFLQDINDFGVVNEIYNEFFEAPYPARCCYAVKALPKNAPIEIEAIAVCED